MTKGTQAGEKPVKKSRQRTILIILSAIVIGCCGLSALVALLGGGDDTTAEPTAIVEASPSPQRSVVLSPTNASSPTGASVPAPPPSTDTPKPTDTLSDIPTPVAVATNTPRPMETSAPAQIPTYQVVDIEDISVPRAVRFRALLTAEFPISIEQINGFCEQVVESIKSEVPVNAVVVFLFDTRSLLSAGYSIAKCEYAPNGVWTDALDAQKGDYSTHKYTYEYQPKVNDPQAALVDRPTEEEYNLCQQWDELASELLTDSTDVAATETIVDEQIAEKNAVSVQTVKDAIFKCTVWTWR